ncbi:UDP-N-acetylglucosamine 4,6-dehydratase (inverting) [Stieleria bergensis]|uniref:UDP-N-acetylglucosamine 4,6-dehydratase (Inverting) n=1 Tax=Stieleria bergensis TaxID=2528025 RepID=A0A517STE4_9BACT|nr:UDP-N-acetylglucosamine 4,6-dehydratase (inverting) [Planctomycetes bacterium SV_7m_r]
MKVFITGVSGFLGRHLSRYLESKGHQVAGVDINVKTIAELDRTNPSIPVLHGSICDSGIIEEIKSLLERECITHVVHAAANKYIDRNEEDPLEAIGVNVTGSANVARICKDLGLPVLGISTDKAENPSSIYGYTKLLMEQLFVGMGYGCYRGVNFFGSDGSVVPVWCAQVQASQSLSVRDLNCIRYFTPIQQVAREIVSLLEQEEPTGSLSYPESVHLLSLGDLLESFISFYDYHDYEVGKMLECEKIEEAISKEIQVSTATKATVHAWLSGMNEFDLLQHRMC